MFRSNSSLWGTVRR